jgi:hypothetical protein
MNDTMKPTTPYFKRYMRKHQRAALTQYKNTEQSTTTNNMENVNNLCTY